MESHLNIQKKGGHYEPLVDGLHDFYQYPVHSTNVVRCFDKRDNKPTDNQPPPARKILIIVGSGNNSAVPEERFKLAVKRHVDDLKRHYPGAEVKVLECPTHDQLETEFKAMETFAETNKEKRPEAMVLVDAHGTIADKFPNEGLSHDVPKWMSDFEGSKIHEIQLSAKEDRYLYSSEMKDYFARYLKNYSGVLYLLDSCHSGANTAKRTPLPLERFQSKG